MQGSIADCSRVCALNHMLRMAVSVLTFFKGGWGGKPYLRCAFTMLVQSGTRRAARGAWDAVSAAARLLRVSTHESE